MSGASRSPVRCISAATSSAVIGIASKPICLKRWRGVGAAITLCSSAPSSAIVGFGVAAGANTAKCVPALCPAIPARRSSGSRQKLGALILRDHR